MKIYCVWTSEAAELKIGREISFSDEGFYPFSRNLSVFKSILKISKHPEGISVSKCY